LLAVAAARPAQELYIDGLDDAAMEALAQLELPSLRVFETTTVGVGNFLPHLAGAPWLPQLEALDLMAYGFIRGALADVGPCHNLESLRLFDTWAQGWADADTAASLSALELPALASLRVGRLASRDVAMLSGAAWWPRLECLTVSLDVEADGALAAVRALLGRPPPRLCSLSLVSRPLCAEALRLLAGAQLPDLCVFRLFVEVEDGAEKSRCIDAALAVLEGAPWRRQCGDNCFVIR
jgi:hypothetical protein